MQSDSSLGFFVWFWRIFCPGLILRIKWVWIRNYKYLRYELGINLRPCLSNNTRDWWWSRLGSVPVSVRLCRGAAMIWILQSDVMFKSTSHYRRILQTLQPHSWFSKILLFNQGGILPTKVSPKNLIISVGACMMYHQLICSGSHDFLSAPGSIFTSKRRSISAGGGSWVWGRPKKISSEVCLVLMTSQNITPWHTM